MHAVCPICSELYKIKTEEIVTTTCGHVFHRSCLESWIQSSRTCPSCRKEPITQGSLIKLFFELDEAKASLSFDEILLVNEELTKELKQVKENNTKLMIKANEAEVKLQEANERTKILERSKQLDDMAIAGLKSIKEDSMKEIVKLNKSIKNLKLDYLAEKQLRRIHQTSLHKLDPDNDNYNVLKVNDNEPKEGETQNGNEMDVSEASTGFAPFWKLNPEAKPIEKDSVKTKLPYIIPSKIQKAGSINFPSYSKNDYLGARRFSVKNDNKSKPVNTFRTVNIGSSSKTSVQLTPSTSSVKDNKSKGFNYFRTDILSSSTSIPDPQPSTSSANPNQNQKRVFGEDKPFSILQPPVVTSASSAFQFASTETPTFQSLNISSSPSAPLNQGFNFLLPTTSSKPATEGFNFNPTLQMFKNFTGFRDATFGDTSPQSARPSTSNLAPSQSSNVNGPKISER